ncbi:hypothetical protein CCP3SC1_440026 [Gammaproteobacteria bacterium]
MTDNLLVEGLVPQPKENIAVDPEQLRMPQSSAHDPSGDDAEEIDLLLGLFALWDIVMKRKRLAIDVFLGCITIALAYAILATPIYKGEVLLSIVSAEKSGGLGGGAS